MKVVDQLVTLQQSSGEDWAPKNFDGKTYGKLPIYLALSRSLNLAMVDLGLRVGVEKRPRTVYNANKSATQQPLPVVFTGG
jgi:penicillin-binding protein 1B